MNIGIFSGSFNPIHIGHLILANYIAEFTDIEEVWFLMTPHNPLKEGKSLLDENMRLEMVKLALEGYPRFKVSDVEFSLPRPSYTFNTLKVLREQYEEHNFSLIIGADNWESFDKWKSYDTILKEYKLYIYPRSGSSFSKDKYPSADVKLLESPVVEISSTFIRNALSEGKNIKAFLPEQVYRYIQVKGLYEK